MHTNDYLHLQLHNNEASLALQRAEYAWTADQLPRRQRRWLPQLNFSSFLPRRRMEFSVRHATMTA